MGTGFIPKLPPGAQRTPGQVVTTGAGLGSPAGAADPRSGAPQQPFAQSSPLIGAIPNLPPQPTPNIMSPTSAMGGSVIANPGVQAPGPGAQPPPPSAAPTGAPAGTPAGGMGADPNLDMTTPGAGETAFNTYGSGFFGPNALDAWSQQSPGAFSNPGQGEQYWNQVAGGLMAPSNSEQAFSDYQKNKPTIDSSAGLAPYYDVAQKRAAETINRGLAARGMYGSTAGLQQLGRSATDLSAEEANRNAAYKLQSLGEQRAWEGLGLQGANAADTTRTARYGLGGQLAMGGEQLGLSRLGEGAGIASTQAGQHLQGLGAGMSSALGAEAARTGRIQSAFGDVAQPSEFTAGLMSNGFNGMIAGDQANFDAGMGLTMGSGANDVNTAAGNDAQTLAKFGLMMDAGGHIVSMGMSPGGMFNPKTAPQTPAPVAAYPSA